MPNFVLISCQFAAFAYNVVNRFTYVLHILAILLRIMNFCFDIIGPYVIILAAIKRDSVSLYKLHILNHLLVISSVISPIYCLMYPNIFSSYFCFQNVLQFVLILILLLLTTVISLLLFLFF